MTKHTESRLQPEPGALAESHTPGPWHVGDDSKLIASPNSVYDIHGHQLAMCSDPHDSSHWTPIADANAALIASAPTLKAQRDELLEALETLVPEHNWGHGEEGGPCPTCTRYATARAAIERARA